MTELPPDLPSDPFSDPPSDPSSDPLADPASDPTATISGSAASTVTARGEPRAAAVRVVHLWKSFGRQSVLRDVTLAFPRGKTTVVLGPSGCGKSVLLKHLVGLLKPDRGEVWLDDTRVDTRPEHQLAAIRRRFGFLFQLGALFDSMSVRENVRFPLAEAGRPDDAACQARIHRVLSMVGLADAMDKMPGELSGGQQKRVALARAIVLEPEVILYDEPTTGLDPIRSDVINELILKLARQLDVTSIVVTHDLASAFKVADWMVMLHEGEVRLQGAPADVRRSPDPVVQRFLRGEASDDELAALGGRSVRPSAEP